MLINFDCKRVGLNCNLRKRNQIFIRITYPKAITNKYKLEFSIFSFFSDVQTMIQNHASSTTISNLIVDAFASMALTPQYFSLDSLTAFSIFALSIFFPVKV